MDCEKQEQKRDLTIIHDSLKKVSYIEVADIGVTFDTALKQRTANTSHPFIPDVAIEPASEAKYIKYCVLEHQYSLPSMVFRISGSYPLWKDLPMQFYVSECGTYILFPSYNDTTTTAMEVTKYVSGISLSFQPGKSDFKGNHNSLTLL